MTWLPPPDPGATCLVTGASSGIGPAIARDLATRGHGVTLVARRAERLRSLAAELEAEHGVRAHALPCDLAVAEQRAGLAQLIGALNLRVAVLVNCAGLGTYGRFVALDPARELEQVRVMCEAVVDLCAAFAPDMATRRSGAVLIVASGIGLLPVPGHATYSAAKSFAVAFGQTLRAELRPSHVAVTTVCPGPVATEFFAVNGDQPAGQVMPRALWTRPEDVAQAAVDGAARNRRLVIPGAAMRALMAAAHLVPPALRLRVADGLLRRATATAEMTP